MRLDRAALPFLVVEGLAAVVLAWAAPWWSAIPIAAALFTAWFFRDPPRSVPQDPAAILSPADGKIIRADGSGVSVFMNVFDVHVCRVPVGGRVASVEHHPGKFFAAFQDAAATENERTDIVVASERGDLRFTLVAGLIARRIVCRVQPGAVLAAGDRVGVIQFGSRVDIQLPPESGLAVRVGDRVVAGVTVLARRGRDASGPPRPSS